MSNSTTNHYIFDEKKPVLVFDAGPLISGIDLFQLGYSNYCVTSFFIIDEEIKSIHSKKNVKSFIDGGVLKVISAPEKYVSLIKTKAKESGDFKSLSECDMQILATSLYLKESALIQFGEHFLVKLISDDYSVLNLAKILKISADPFRRTGIKNKIKWDIYCPACHKTYDLEKISNLIFCSSCGEKLKKKPKIKGKVKMV